MTLLTTEQETLRGEIAETERHLSDLEQRKSEAKKAWQQEKLGGQIVELHERLGISTVLVMGGCGDYFDVADTVIEMREYLPTDVTARAKSVAASQPTRRQVEVRRPLAAVAGRVPIAKSLDPSHRLFLRGPYGAGPPCITNVSCLGSRVPGDPSGHHR